MDIMTGFCFQLGKKDIFVRTNLKNKTENLAQKILNKLLLPDNPSTRKELLYWIQKANCKIVTLSSGRRYYEIFGDDFGGRGSFLDDGMTIIIDI